MSLILLFCATHLGLFFAAFECALIPVVLIVGSFGTRNERLTASLQLFYYTLLGSFLMLLSFYCVYSTISSLYMSAFVFYLSDLSTECSVALALLAPLSIKTPLYPFHIWLPLAHVEAPTIGSVLLAALILKMSGFGFIRVLLPLCPRACAWFSFFVLCICIIGGTYAGFTAASQTDLKRIIAASSIVHMSYATIGVFNIDLLSIISCIYAMFAHGLISAGLFFAIGCSYFKYGERDLSFFTNLHKKLPALSFAFLFLCFSNMAFPGTANFPSEIGIFLGTFINNGLMAAILMLPIIINGAFNIWGVTRLCFGPDKVGDVIMKIEELTINGGFILYSLIFFILMFGLFAQLILCELESFVKLL